ncbi:hypothetical protein TVAG_533980 [Trichomonas vaginalis G3]|uniref:Uncharacterized protein n=1 Tax=Trichomonas vaginalis (strain ATCC PRA-98 / G3) TaxID=412133 RepID=A2G1P5_TRIV3|nr:hypothetical protein TVAGG3_0750340 [Trichomonas vaginalis G3]EAX88931.1 hypothetical protein TVAG_533980 [Trichomonas vaginalis G3]KAI5512500.1 hypothetical protein TVAGG3_0750340 [Trichomonas vaginalis G3]|eukprot:XP_001301861.1 hypothetical protein [Trichomonas vaginalis G3]
MILSIRGTGFTKKHSCADCGTDMHLIVRGYMKIMSGYPVEFGLQISKMPYVVTHDEIADVFSGRTLSLALSYWDSDSEGEWANLIKCVTTIAANEF